MKSTGKGEINYSTAAGDITQNANTTTAQGDVNYRAQTGAITMTANAETAATVAGDIHYTADQDITVNKLTTNAANQVQITSDNGAILVQDQPAAQDVNITTGDLSLSAKKNIGTSASPLKTSITRLVAQTTGPNADIYIGEQGGLELTQVSTQNGNLNLTAQGDVVAQNVNVKGDVTLNTTGQFVTAQPTGLVQADHLNVTADELVQLNTQVNDANIRMSNAGNIELNEKDAIHLSHVETPNGNISVTATNTISVDQILAGGVLAAGQVQLNSLHGNIERSANSLTDSNIIAQDVNLIAATGIGSVNNALTTQVNSLAANTIAQGIYLNQQGNLTLKDLVTPADVMLNVNGGLVAANNTQLTANQATVNAQGSIEQLNTSVNRLNVATTEGDITVHELNGLDRVNAKTSGGNIQITTATGNLGLGLIQAADTSSVATATQLGQVNLTATTGAIQDADQDDNAPINNIVGQSLTAAAATGIGSSNNHIEIDVNNLTAQTQTGGIYVNKLTTGALNLVAANNQPALSAQTGDISIQTAGPLNIQNNIQSATNGNINLSAQGDINQNADIITHAQGNVTVQSDANITMSANQNHTSGASTSTDFGQISYSAGDTMSVSYLKSSESGGSISITAPKLVDQIVNADNVVGALINIQSPMLDRNLTEQLISEKLLESVLIRLNYQVVGGSLSNSRKFMSDLFLQQQLASAIDLVKSDLSLNNQLKLVNTDLIK